MQVTKKQFAVNALWKMLEQFGSKGISMVVSIVLARILMPEDYGLIAIAAIFTGLSDILIDGGFSTALVQKKDIDEEDYGAVFTVSICIATFLYLILFITAPYVAGYYDQSELTLVLRIMGITFFIQAFTAVRNGIVNRNMRFKELFMCNMAATLLSGIVGIVCALTGFGVWALVIQRLLQTLLLNLFLLFRVSWKCRLCFRPKRIKAMLGFSSGVVGSSLLSYASSMMYTAFIGKNYSVSDLGYYDKGIQTPQQLSLYTFGAMSNVLLPTISACQDDLGRVKHIVRKVIRYTCFLIAPLMAVLAITSEDVIVILFTEKWLPATQIMQWMCLYNFALPFSLVCVQVYFALGKSYIRIRVELVRLVMLILLLIYCALTPGCTIYFLACLYAFVGVFIAGVSYFEVRRLLRYTLPEMSSDIWKSIICTMLASVTMIAVKVLLTANVFVSFFLTVFVGCVVYVLMSVLFRNDCMTEVAQMIKTRFHRD